MRRRLLRAPVSSGVSVAALAPMVDVLTILLVFLLRSYSTDPPVRPEDPGFSLPLSTSEAPAQPGRTVEITRDAILLNGARLTSTAWYTARPGVRVEELYAPLAADPGGRLRLVVDAQTPYGLIRQVLATARDAGVRDLSVVAASRAGL